MRIGVLGIQGSVEEHLKVLKKVGVDSLNIKKIEDLEKIDGLIIPGGESTTVGKLLQRFGLKKEITRRARKGLPIWGTCAGAILMAKEVSGDDKVSGLGLMDLVIERNAYGRQIDSFETKIDFNFGKNFKNEKQKVPAVFIRAPKILKVGKKCRVLSNYKGEIIAVREGNLLATTFHPELTDDYEIHKWFLGNFIPCR